MFNSNLPEPDLLKTLLEPLLDDFQYWFEQSRSLLESQDISFLGNESQTDLLARVKQAQQEVNTTRMLLEVTAGQVGVETAVLVPWHELVTECWKVAVQLRLQQAAE